MFDFEKPNIEIAEISEDKRYRSEERRVGKECRRSSDLLRHNSGKFPEKNHAFFFTGFCCQPGEN